MAESSGFWPDVDGDRSYDDEFLAKWVASFISNGVYYSELQVVAADDGLAVILMPGRAWINGRKYENDSPLRIDLTPAAAIPNMDRYTSIMIRSDSTGRIIRAKMVDSATSAQPVVVEPTRNAEIHELMTAYVSVRAGAVNVSQADIHDTRLDEARCGIVTNLLGDFDTQQFYEQIAADLAMFKEQYQAEFEVWFESIQDILDENTAGHLLNLINQITPDATAVVNAGKLVISSNKPRTSTLYDVRFDMPTGYIPGSPVTIDGAVMTGVYRTGTENEVDLSVVPAGVPLVIYRQGNRAFCEIENSLPKWKHASFQVATGVTCRYEWSEELELLYVYCSRPSGFSGTILWTAPETVPRPIQDVQTYGVGYCYAPNTNLAGSFTMIFKPNGQVIMGPYISGTVDRFSVDCTIHITLSNWTLPN